MDEEFYTNVWSLFHHFVNDLNDKMFYAIEFEKNNFRLQAPSFLIDILRDSMIRISGDYQHWVNSGNLFEGIIIEPTYEMAIVLFHTAYPIHRNEWMLKKISLEAPFVIKEDRFNKTIIKIREFSPVTQKGVSEN